MVINTMAGMGVRSEKKIRVPSLLDSAFGHMGDGDGGIMMAEPCEE